jgi:hypothetical protein
LSGGRGDALAVGGIRDRSDAIGVASQQELVPVVFGLPGHVRPKLAACAGVRRYAMGYT